MQTVYVIVAKGYARIMQNEANALLSLKVATMSSHRMFERVANAVGGRRLSELAQAPRCVRWHRPQNPPRASRTCPALSPTPNAGLATCATCTPPLSPHASPARRLSLLPNAQFPALSRTRPLSKLSRTSSARSRVPALRTSRRRLPVER